MRIVIRAHTDRRLVLELRPTALMYVFFGLLFIAMGVACAAVAMIPEPQMSADYNRNKLIGLPLLGVVCVIGGVACLHAVERVLAEFDRSANTLRLVRKRLFGRDRTTSLVLDAIEGVRLKRCRVTTPRGQVTESWWVQLAVRGAPVTSLTAYPMFRESEAARVKALITAFIARH